MQDLRNGTGYCVVPMNSTSGMYIVESTNDSQLRQSNANIAGVWSTKKEAQKQADELNNVTEYRCSIGDYEATLAASTPQEAARKCVEKRMREFDWFANQSPELASVEVDGETYEPRSMVGNVELSWDFK